MKARLPKGYGRPDPNAMMRQVQKMQDEIRAKQEELEAKEYTGTASGEMVTVTMTGKHEICLLYTSRCQDYDAGYLPWPVRYPVRVAAPGRHQGQPHHQPSR